MTPAELADAARVASATANPEPARTARDEAVHALSARRWRVALSLTAVMLVVYFSFVLGIAFDKAALGRLLMPGLSLGMVLGVGVIVTAFGLTALYARWANQSYDPALERAIATPDVSRKESRS
jgi:uncharacterized membrane protein (DUF485 family)